MGLSFVAVFLFAGTMSTSEIVEAQAAAAGSGVILLLPSFLIYVISMVGETNRAPFDLPEGEGELVGGFHTEYSSLKFALFFLAEYVNMVTVSALATTLFLGGWRAPWPISLWDGANAGWWPLLWFLVKVVLFIFFFIWLRGTLPRMRYDQFMALRLEGADPGLPGVDRAGRHVRALSLRRRRRPRPTCSARSSCCAVARRCVLVFARRRPEQEARRAEDGRRAGRSTPSPAASRCRRCPPASTAVRPAATAPPTESPSSRRSEETDA